MMEKRVIELKAKDARIGSSFSLRLNPPSEPLRLGETIPFDLELELSKDAVGVELLEPIRSEGLRSVQDGFPVLPPKSEGVPSHVILDLVLEGVVGRGLLEVAVKDPDYGSTLGQASEELNVLPYVMTVAAAEGSIAFDPVEGGELELVLSRKGTDRYRCDLELEMSDGSGGKVPLRDPLKRGLVLRSELRTKVELRPINPMKEGAYSLDVTVMHGGIKDRTRLNGIIQVGPAADGVPDGRTDAQEKGLLVRRLEAHPRSVLPGETVTITLECEVPEGSGPTIKPLLRLGRGTSALVEMPPLDGQGRSISLFVPGPDMAGGDASCELILMDDGRTVHREVRSRLVTIERTSKMELLVRTSQDLVPASEGPLKGLLLPSEKPASLASTAELSVWTLSSGRSIIGFGGNIMGRASDPPEERERARKLHLLHCARAALTRGDLLRSLRGSADTTGTLLKALERISHEDESDLRERDTHKGWAASIVRSKEGLEGAGPWTSTDDPRMGELRERISDLFGLGHNVTSDIPPSDALRDLLERFVNDLRKDLARPRRGEVHDALKLLTEVRRGALDALTKGMSGDRIGQGAADLIMSLCLERLVRLEVLTAWDDPAVNAWEELRTERQRTVKAAVGALLAIPSRLSELSKAANDRFDACMRNMGRRWAHRSMAHLTGCPGSIDISGTGGTVWEKKVTLEFGTLSQPIEVRAFIRLPGRAWQLLSPRAERRGELMDLGGMTLDGNNPSVLTLRVRPPHTPPPEAKGILYLVPENLTLEAEL